MYLNADFLEKNNEMPKVQSLEVTFNCLHFYIVKKTYNLYFPDYPQRFKQKPSIFKDNIKKKIELNDYLSFVRNLGKCSFNCKQAQWACWFIFIPYSDQSTRTNA